MTRRLLLLGLFLAAAFAMGPSCPSGPAIVIRAPRPGQIFEDTPSVVAAAAQLRQGLDAATATVDLDGVDLVAALGLTPPFVDEGGVVSVGGTPVTVSDFSFLSGSSPQLVGLTLTGLGPAPHELVVAALNGSGQVVWRRVDFLVTGPMTLELDELPAGGSVLGAVGAGPEGTLVNESLAQPFAAPPVGLADGGTLRAGFVESAEARIAGAAP